MGLLFVPFPGRSSSGDQVLGESTLPGVLCLITSLPYHHPVPAAQFPGCAVEAPSQVCCASPLGSLPLAATLLGMSIVQDPRKTWLATGSLLAVWWRMPSLGPRLPLTFQLWLLPVCLSDSRWGWAFPELASSPLAIAQSFVL